MLYFQLTQVLLVRPRRDRTFWAVVAYSVVLAVIITLAIVARIRFTELEFVQTRDAADILKYYLEHADSPYNVITHFWCVNSMPVLLSLLMGLSMKAFPSFHG
jgi:hypothetical protein